MLNFLKTTKNLILLLVLIGRPCLAYPIYKVAIIGAGPAGYTAGIYTARAKFSTIIIEGLCPGGQLTTTTKIENWPGNIEIMGPALMESMRNHAQTSGCDMLETTITSVNFDQHPFKLYCDNGQTVQAEAVIIATGSSHKKLDCPGEDEYLGRGVSVCATCDAPFFKDQEVIVVGGGNSAMVEAEHLAHFAKKITVINNLDELTANDALKFKVLKNPKTSIKNQTIIKEIQGNGIRVTQVVLENVKDHATAIFKADGVFVAVGMTPNSKLFKNVLEMDDNGYLIVKEGMQTSKPGVFAAGEIADPRYRQAITSAGFGCMAALDCQRYLNTHPVLKYQCVAEQHEIEDYLRN